LLEISFSLQQCKNFWNQLRFDKVIAKVRDHSFFWDTGYIREIGKLHATMFRGRKTTTIYKKTRACRNHINDISRYTAQKSCPVLCRWSTGLADLAAAPQAWNIDNRPGDRSTTGRNLDFRRSRGQQTERNRRRTDRPWLMAEAQHACLSVCRYLNPVVDFPCHTTWI